jgi:thiol-disulfide isomerase/thioredoxin
MSTTSLRGPDGISSRRTSPDRIRTVTSGTFEELVLDADGPVVAEFMSYGCTHCRAMEPVLQQVAGMVEPDVTVVRVNIGVDHELASSYQVQGTPTLIMFLDGREVARVEGPPPTVATVLAAVTQPFEA